MKTYLKTFYSKTFKSLSIWGSIFFVAVALAIFPKSYSFDPTVAIEVMGAIISTGLVMAIVLGYGGTLSTIKSTNLSDTFKITGVKKIEMMLLSLIPAFTIFFAYVGLSISLIAIYEAMGQLPLNELVNAPVVPGMPTGNANFWSATNWLAVISSLFVSFGISLSISIMIALWTKSDKTYNNISYSYVLAVFLFGGATMPITLLRPAMDKYPVVGDGEELKAFIYIGRMIPSSYGNFMVADAIGTSRNAYDLSQQNVLFDLIGALTWTTLFTSVSIYQYRKW